MTFESMLSQLYNSEHIDPVFYGESGVPFCNENCPQHDGKRCRVLGMRPDNICEPTVVEMARLLRQVAP